MLETKCIDEYEMKEFLAQASMCHTSGYHVIIPRESTEAIK